MEIREGYGGDVFTASDSFHIGLLVAQMRDVGMQKDAHLFGKNATEIGKFLAYEIDKSDSFNGWKRTVRTVLGEAEYSERSQEPLVLNVLRAANPLVSGTLEVFRQSPVAFLDAKRKEGSYNPETGEIEVDINYESIPVNTLEGRALLVPDIMLATGSSLVAVYQNLAQRFGQPSEVIVSSVIAAEEGVKRVLHDIADARVYTAAIDPDLNDMGYIVPGLGDAGDLCYNGGL